MLIGLGRDRTGDLTIFRRSLVPTELQSQTRFWFRSLKSTTLKPLRPGRDLNAKNLSNAVSSNVNSSVKKEPKKIVSDAATRVSSYANFITSVFVIIFLYFLVVWLNLPYIINLILGFCAAAALYFLFNYFQNRLP